MASVEMKIFPKDLIYLLQVDGAIRKILHAYMLASIINEIILTEKETTSTTILKQVAMYTRIEWKTLPY